jgi:mannose-6-phosphate isomerase-like protein (cupin superfamily)
LKKVLFMLIKRSVQDAPVKVIDDSLKISNLFDGAGFQFDFVIAELDGEHPIVVNKVSDRCYFILEGEGVVSVGEEVHDVRANDLVLISKNSPHSISGSLKYIIITSPPFDPENEE